MAVFETETRWGRGPKGDPSLERLDQPIKPEILGASRGSLGLYF